VRLRKLIAHSEANIPPITLSLTGATRAFKVNRWSSDLILRRGRMLALSILALFFLAIPFAFYFYNFNSSFSSGNSDWGSFGSYIGGTVGVVLSGLSFVILSFTLLTTLEHNKSEREISNNTYKLSEESYKQQLKHQRNEFNLQLINSYIEAIDIQLKNKDYSAGACKDEEEFLERVLKEFARMKEVNPKNDFFTNASCALISLHVRYDNECVTLQAIEKIIIEEEDESVRRHLHCQLAAKINPERIFWIQMYLCHCADGYKEKIINNSLLSPSSRLLDAFPEHNKKRKGDV